MDDLMVDTVKSGKSMVVMVQKLQLKQTEKRQKYNHSDAIVDWAVSKKGRGRSVDLNSRKKKRGVIRKIRRLFKGT